MYKKIDIYYFSGTGNTILALGKMDEVFKEKGVETACYPIEKSGIPSPPAPGTALGLAFPASTQSTMPFIWNFFKKLPRVENVPVFMIMTMNEGAGVTGSLYKLLKRKGYIPVGAAEISMPQNALPEDFDETQTAERMEKSSRMAREFAHNLLEEKTVWKKENSGNAFVAFLSRATPLPWISMRLIFKIATEKNSCNKCGLCIRECPVQNIKEQTAGELRHGNNCQFCMRCIAGCPKQAVKTSGKKPLHVRTLLKKEDAGF